MADAPDSIAPAKRTLDAGRLRGLVVAVVVGAFVCSATTPHPASPAAIAAPDPIDVSAAQASAVFAISATGVAPGSQVLTAVKPLVAGAVEDAASNGPLPKWAALGSDLVLYAGDSSDTSTDRVKLLGEVNEVIDDCNSNTADAKAAGGYTDLPHAF